jgi:hypothetical protein
MYTFFRSATSGRHAETRTWGGVGFGALRLLDEDREAEEIQRQKLRTFCGVTRITTE